VPTPARCAARHDRDSSCEKQLSKTGLRLKAELLKITGEERIRLSPEQHQRLNILRKKMDPEVLKRIDVLFDAE